MHFRIPVLTACLATGLHAGPYSLSAGDPANPHDAPVPGFTGPDGAGKSAYQNPGNRVNPLFFTWAAEVIDYQRSDTDASFSDPELALGPVTGDPFDVVSLGDLTATAIEGGDLPGSITLRLAKPVRNLSGADFVIFENGFLSQSNQGGAGAGSILGELAYVEVSADDTTWFRFPATSLTAAAVGPYGTIDPSDLHQLAGKHVNAGGHSWGTPFDLAAVGLEEISHVRLVDIPGNGASKDTSNRPIYDAWHTFGSGGFDLEAVGGISTVMTFPEWPELETLPATERGEAHDPDHDGISNLLEYAFATDPSRPDESATGHAMVGGALEIEFRRDERAVDLIYEVQAADALEQWETIARGSGGEPLAAADGFTPVISETAAGEIASVGVIRSVRVQAAAGQRFLRVKVSRISLP